VIKEIVEKLAERGMKGAAAPVERLEDIKREMDEIYNGGVQTQFTKWWVSVADKYIPDDLGFEPRSVLAVVAFSPKVALRFAYKGKRIDCILPPTYGEAGGGAGGNEAGGEAGGSPKSEPEIISGILGQYGFKSKSTNYVPQKLLAAHCGLGQYGRNNIFYCGEYGSYVKIYTFITDMPCGGDGWGPAARMDACETCDKCVAACPTGAIDPDRRFIDADRCLTALNERDGEFPDWLDKSAHNSLVGCVKCQDCCPMNAKHAGNIARGAEFTESETLELLNCKQGEPIPDEILKKFKSNGVWKHFARLMPRNLAALLDRL